MLMGTVEVANRLNGLSDGAKTTHWLDTVGQVSDKVSGVRAHVNDFRELLRDAYRKTYEIDQ